MYFIEKIKAREQNLQNCPKILKGGVRKHKANLKITHLRSHSSWNNAWIKIACSAKNLIGRIIALLLCPNISSLKVIISYSYSSEVFRDKKYFSSFSNLMRENIKWSSNFSGPISEKGPFSTFPVWVDILYYE